MIPYIVLIINLYNYHSFFSERVKVAAIFYIQLISSENTISWSIRDVKLYALKLDMPIFLTKQIMNSTPLKEKKL